ncbi:carboxypeptidase-like regulatory domain-containing protein [Mucilaginibacter sp.]|uniref:carboxypeptidase-like regulatory domain-containing protein n=1 Tax=Mucilaginibacter sp. TaxID=1882438 RepID=UPI003D10C74A
MKYLLLFIFLIATARCYGQQLSGKVTDKDTHEPVNGALVSLHGAHAYTNMQGEFSIINSGITDSIKVNHFAYKTYASIISKGIITIHIDLEPIVIGLKQVIIHANRENDFKVDSINNRIAYSKQFNYTGPKVMDAFKGDMANRQPGELISINPLLLIAALTKKSTPEYKFHQVLLRDEKDEYVDRKFNRGIASRITGLKGDSLSAFITGYRPDYKFAKKATDYEMINYIKESCKQFKAGGLKGNDPFIKM